MTATVSRSMEDLLHGSFNMTLDKIEKFETQMKKLEDKRPNREIIFKVKETENEIIQDTIETIEKKIKE